MIVMIVPHHSHDEGHYDRAGLRSLPIEKFRPYVGVMPKKSELETVFLLQNIGRSFLRGAKNTRT